MFVQPAKWMQFSLPRPRFLPGFQRSAALAASRERENFWRTGTIF
jgi:hypothetical protein